MKKITAFCVMSILLFSLTACGGTVVQNTEQPRDTLSVNKTDGTKGETGSTESEKEEVEVDTDANILVAYFSATGATESVAEYAAEILGADIYEMIPEVPYADEDLAYYTDGRADQEQNDAAARPAIAGSVSNMEQYDTVLIGYPKLEYGFLCV